MKKLLFAIFLTFLYSVSAYGQVPTNIPNTVIQVFPGAPTGACLSVMIATRQDTGAFYDCFGGVWTPVGGAGAGANSSLSNLSNPTAVNQSLIPGTTGLTLGTQANPWANVYMQNLTFPGLQVGFFCFPGTLPTPPTGYGGLGCIDANGLLNEYNIGASAWEPLIATGDPAGGVLSGSFPNPGFATGVGTPASPTNSIQFNAGAIFGAVTPPATPGTFVCGYTVPSTSSVAPTCPQQGSIGRSINASNYTTGNTVLYSDNLFGLSIDAATGAAVTLSLPTPTTLNNSAFAFPIVNGSPIASSVVPVTWTVNGLPSFTIPAAAPTTQAASYAFTTVENPLSKFGNFSVAGSGYAVTQVPSGGVVEPTTRNAFNGAFYTGQSWAPNQCSTVTVLTLGGTSGQNFVYADVRMSASAATSYGVQVDGPSATSGRQVQLTAYVAGTAHILVTTVASITVNVADTLGLCVVTSGSSAILTVFHNGAQIGSPFTDSTYASSISGGSPGFAFYVQSAAVTDAQISAFSATGSIVGVPPVRCVFGIDPFNSTNWLGNCGASFSATGQNIASGYGTAANCSSSASPAVCGSAAAGSVSVPTGTDPTLVVDTSAVTPTSQIILQIDESLGAKLNVTCNSTLSSLGTPLVTTRIAGTSFTIEMDSTVATNPVCLNYTVVN